MKKIGKEVLFIKAKEGNPRNGESTMVRLPDGRIMFAFTEYCGDNWLDHATARISACYSGDEGESWTDSSVILPKPEGALNIMSPSLFLLADGMLGMVYLRKDKHDDTGVTCMPMFVSSEDNGQTWSEAVTCGFPEGYYCAINDGVLVTKSGRIYVPASYSGRHRDIFGTMNPAPAPHTSDVRLTYSDDNGATWHLYPHIFTAPFADSVGIGEPGLFEFENGNLWMYARSAYGHQYQSLSYNGGKSWTPVEPNFRFTSPDAPMRVKRIGKYVAAVFNPLAYNCLRTDTELWGSPKRTPIVVAISKDDAKSFTDRTMVSANGALQGFSDSTYLLEDDTANSYCYPSIVETKDGFLVSYYHSDNTNICLRSSKVVKIYNHEIESSGTERKEHYEEQTV